MNKQNCKLCGKPQEDGNAYIVDDGVICVGCYTPPSRDEVGKYDCIYHDGVRAVEVLSDDPLCKECADEERAALSSDDKWLMRLTGNNQ